LAGFHGVKAEYLYKHVVRQIEEKILNGELAVGDKLPTERELVKQFQVSRTVVREAIKILQQKGLVGVYPGRGTFIVDSMSQSVQDSLGLLIQSDESDGLGNLVEVRSLLEPEIAALAAARATPEDIEMMRKAVAEMDAALDNADIFIEADLDFHIALANATQNSLIPLLIDPIVEQLRVQRKAIFLVAGGAERGQFHHNHILDAVIRRDPRAAQEAMRVHLHQVIIDSGIAWNRTDTEDR
jgi:GntR family transcriptional repressor for pyruvate dehydrogenase complex